MLFDKPSTLRFFARAGRADERPAGSRTWRVVVDAFHLQRTEPRAEPRDIVVALDDCGFLGVIPESELANPSRIISEQLAYHEVAYGELRTLLAPSFHLFEIEHVDLAPDVPGVNDPVYVHGRMFGPFPERDDATRFAEHGHLTVTRSELLDSFVHGYEHAMRYEGGGEGGAGQCFHMLLPGDRASALNAGHGLVLAYPLLPTDLSLRNGANDVLVMHTVYLVLTAIERELGNDRTKLPVPSRKLVERLLRAEGFEIEGGIATRKRNGILGSLFREKITLPAQGTLTDFVTAASDLLVHCEGHPTPRSIELRRRWAFNRALARGDAPRFLRGDALFGLMDDNAIPTKSQDEHVLPCVSPIGGADDDDASRTPSLAELIAQSRAVKNKKR